MLRHGRHSHGGYCVTNANTDGYPHANTDTYPHANTDTYPHANTDTYPHANTDTYPYTGVLPQFHDGRRVRCT
jgi:hypothetical protein